MQTELCALKKGRINVESSLWIFTQGKTWCWMKPSHTERRQNPWHFTDDTKLRRCAYWEWVETTKEREKSQTFPGRPPPGRAPACLLPSWLVLLETQLTTINSLKYSFGNAMFPFQTRENILYEGESWGQAQDQTELNSVQCLNCRKHRRPCICNYFQQRSLH